MKKNNKKGFTLIELLAVIIILGVIMLIAIPSVTSQISTSRKNTYSKTAQEFINSVIKIVNAGNMEVFDTETLYAIPVGNDADKSCVKMESGGTSPYSNEYKYAYVWFTYDGNGYNYSVTVQDKTDQGIITTSSAELSKRNYDSVQAVGKHKENTTLTTQYGKTNKDEDDLFTCDQAGDGKTCATGTDTANYAAINTFAQTDDAGLKELLTKYKKIYIFAKGSCIG